MMKRLLSLSLSLLMLLSLAVPAASAAETKPTPPAWVKGAASPVSPVSTLRKDSQRFTASRLNWSR